MFGLLLVCIILVCARKKTKSGVGGTIGFLPQRMSGEDGTLDRRAMIEDTSSEDSRSETNSAPPYVQQVVFCGFSTVRSIKIKITETAKIETCSSKGGTEESVSEQCRTF